MVKEKEGREKNNKKAPAKSQKEKRAAKVAKRAEKNRSLTHKEGLLGKA